jgi:hypothetical protein
VVLDLLIKELEDNRPSWEELDKRRLAKAIHSRDKGDAIGKIAERYVRMWLSRCPSVPTATRIPRYRRNGVYAKRTASGIQVYEGKRRSRRVTVCDFDTLVEIDGQVVIGEVKAGRLPDTVTNQLDTLLRYGEKLFGRSRRLLLFHPHNGDNGSELEERYDGKVKCVDLMVDREEISRLAGYVVRQSN